MTALGILFAMKQDRVTLRQGKEKALHQHHPWVFSGAVASGGKNRTGELLPVYSVAGQLLGSGYFNTRSSIIGRMLCFDGRPPLEALQQHIQAAITLREKLISEGISAYRLINGEGDGLPGLIVDRYGDILVFQIGTLGMERLKDEVLEALQKRLRPRAIYEKSLQPSRHEEGLQNSHGWRLGTPIEAVEIRENGLRFIVSPEQGQKTGFFLDQREMRSLVRRYGMGRRVLNCFAYTGAFSVAALAGGARHVTSVDTSAPALEMATAHVALNNLPAEAHTSVVSDVFQYLREQDLHQNLIILDPPAFAKRRADVIRGCRGYKDINRLTIAKAPPGALLVTCSCSHFVDDQLFQKVVFQASLEAQRSVRILARHHAAFDHPVSIYHPEAHYLKSLLLYIE